jgi:phage antirepressor YoqD-like protein
MALEISVAEFSAVYKDQQLIDRPCFNLPEDLTITLVTGYSIPMRHRINKQWLVMKSAPAPKPVYSIEDFAVALLESKAQNRLLIEKLETAQPSVEFVDTYVKADGLMNTTQVATKLGMSARALNKLLKEMGYKQNTLSGKDVLTIKGVNSGWFASKSWGKNGQVGEQLYITPAGVLALSQMLAE